MSSKESSSKSFSPPPPPPPPPQPKSISHFDGINQNKKPPPPPPREKISQKESKNEKSKPPPPKGPKKPKKEPNSKFTPVYEAVKNVSRASLNPFNDGAEGSQPSSSSSSNYKKFSDTEYDSEVFEHENPISSPNSPNNAAMNNPVAENSQEEESEADSNVSLNHKRNSKELRALHNYGHPYLGKGEPENKIYHQNRYSIPWFFLFLVIHLVQFILLLTVGFKAFTPAGFAIFLILLVLVVVLLILSRLNVKKSNFSSAKNIELNHGVCTPEMEADDVSDRAILYLSAASVVEGLAFAIFTSVTSNSSSFSTHGFFTKDMLLQTLRFASITILALHRILRPANRIDPLRTVLEIEVVSVCWDALDGSTLFELLDGQNFSTHVSSAIRFLMAFWYLSVGVRVAMMFMTHLSPTHPWYHKISTYPFELGPQPTVDRTLQGIRIRSVVTLIMTFAELYAAILRLYLWIIGALDSLQQDMAIKNILFIISFSGAYEMFKNTKNRNWNSRDLMYYPFYLRYPSRLQQVKILRWLFVVSYLLVSGLMTYILVQVDHNGQRWTANLVIDIILILVFLVYCRSIYDKEDSNTPKFFFIPRSQFFSFPYKLGIALGFFFFISLLGVRLPSLFYNYDKMATSGSGKFYTYQNAMLMVILTILPIACYSYYWSLSYMLFRKEFTASPGNYNAIHDPAIYLVSVSTMAEGALDILSCATLMQLATYNLPPSINGAIVIFCLLEVVNAIQCFGLPCLLSGGHDDTPKDLVRWNAALRFSRGIIDFGTIILRLVLWINYNALSSVFLVKNLYNLIHSSTQTERWYGVNRYPKGTLFSEFVPPPDWYGMTKEQWRAATRETLLDQARAGRRV